MKKASLVKKWLNNNLSAAEKKDFNAMDDAEFNEYIVNSARRFKASHFYQVDDFETFKTHYHTNKASRKTWFHGKYWLKIACVLAVSVGVYLTLFKSSTEKIITLASQKLTVELPDHTMVELNALSQLEYEPDNWSESRKLMLRGEAFFSVAKGKTFSVYTDDGLVSVIGTKFNVKQRERYFEVRCYEGHVKVQSDTVLRHLYAGDVFKIVNGIFTQEQISTNKPSWVDGMSTFEVVPIREVLAELERQYQIEVITKNIDLDRLFTGAFKHDNLEEALKAITLPMHLTFEFVDSTLVVIYERNH
ncbi:FecR family protein [Aestuariivivens sediminicola]|uniref:FecR family protein n=1 Tax=Aestuariivivens sediminicola TaxID=2913560 RepID=UPI001F598B7B|nr:FecR domain-containing protein [Aestuariivivens sediminicola]